MVMGGSREDTGSSPESTDRTRNGRADSELLTTASDGFFPKQVGAASASRVGNASMKTNPARFAAGLALVAFGAPISAFGQYFPPPLIIVPPQGQEYLAPKPTPKPPPVRPNPPADATPPAKSTGHYQGRTFVPD
jgi:hypothetical protein